MRIAAVLLAALIGSAPAWAENRALIIGNADYRSAPDLAGSDTSALGNALREAGFTTQQGVDLEAGPLRRLIESLVRADVDPGARIVALNGRFLHDATETWFMGTDVDSPGTMTVAMQGVPLSLVMRLLAGGDPGSVLILGTDGQQMPHRFGLENGIGILMPPDSVWVLTGTPEAGARAMMRLLAGDTAAQTAAADRALALLPQNADDLTLAPFRKNSDTLNADHDAWAEAAVADSAGAYQDYLSRFPSGVYAVPARLRLAQIGRAPGVRDADRAAWADALAADTAPAYSAYLKDFPIGRYVGAARKRMAELRPAPPTRPIAPQIPTGAAAEQTLGLGPAERGAIQRKLSLLGQQPGAVDGVFGPRTRLALSGWQRANNLPVTGYLTSSQLRMIAAQAERRAAETAAQDRAWWQETGASGDTEGLRAYLRRYPQGLHADAARRQLTEAGAGPDTPRGDAATWGWARRQGSAAAYETYLERFPQGAQAAEARERLTTLRAGTEAARREEASLDLTPSTRRLIEERLRVAGMQPGPVDGEFTEETRAALRRYQATRNLRVTGYVTQQTVSRLLTDVLR